MVVAGQLFRLEQLDTEVEGREAALNELRRRWQHDPKLQAAEATVERLRTTVEKESAEQRSLESDLADLEGRIKRDNTRMYSGNIVDPRELSSIEKEIAHHKGQRDAVEERLLETMERLEDSQTQLREGEEAAVTARKRREAEQPEIQRQGRALQADVKQLRTQRDELASTLDAPSVAMYDRLRKSSGHAVSVVSNGICQWCRVSIPSKDVQHARSALVMCNNCARILYIQ